MNTVTRSKPSKTTPTWEKLIYLDEENKPCVDLIVDGVKHQFPIQDLVCLVYHGRRPANNISYVIDISKRCTPVNVGWISKDALLQDRAGGSTTKEIKRRMIRPKMVAKWKDLFSVNDDGALYLDGNYDGQWKQYLVADYLSESYPGPWPAQDSYAFIINMSKPIHAINVAWMMQNPDYRNVYGWV
jgi:hypothetical protein